MTFLYSLIALLIGLAAWSYLIYKQAALVPFAKQNMADRRARIAEQLQAADDSKARLEKVHGEISDNVAAATKRAEEIMARAREDAVAEAQAIEERARREADSIMERAKADIGTERDAAIAAIRSEVAGIVVDASGAVLTGSLDEKAHQRLIERSLTRVEAEGK